MSEERLTTYQGLELGEEETKEIEEELTINKELLKLLLIELESVTIILRRGRG